MRLQKLTGLERDKIIKDYNDVIALIADLESILGFTRKSKSNYKRWFCRN